VAKKSIGITMGKGDCGIALIFKRREVQNGSLCNYFQNHKEM
jgi:hypothetical protein